MTLLLAALVLQECCVKGEPQPWSGYDVGIKWERDPEEALVKAKEKGKPVLWFRIAGALDREGCSAVGHAMRTVTFADGEIAAYVNDKFVATWSSRAPKYHNCETDTEKRIATMKGEIFASRDAVTFVIDADRRVMHTFSGFYAPEHFVRELLFARDVFEARSNDERAGLHEKRSKELEGEETRLRKLFPQVGPGFREKMEALASLFRDVRSPKRDDRVRMGDEGRLVFVGEGGWERGEAMVAVWRSRRDHMADGLRHLHRVNRWIGGKSRQRGEMPSLDQVWQSPDASDSFLEE